MIEAKLGRVRKPGGRGLALYTSVTSQILSLARNVVVARLLGPEEFGLAAAVILAMGFLESFSNAGPQNLLIQAKDKDVRPHLAAAHAVTLSRGLATGLLLLATAIPLSSFLGLRFGWPAVGLLAASALFSGFLHRGARLVQRDGDFRPDSITQLSGDIAALVVAILVASISHSHIAIVFALAAKSATSTIMSHFLAPQQYEISWSRNLLQRFWIFGWPLLINGPLLFLSSQADRVFISRELGVAALGTYSAVLVLIMSPSNAILRWLGTIYMPRLSRNFHQVGNLKDVGVVFNYSAMMLLLGTIMFLGFAILGDFVVHILYGSRYEMPAFLIALIGCLQIFRFLRAWPSTLALSAAASAGILVSTIVRLMALPMGYLGMLVIGGLPGLLSGFIVGEAIALLVNLAIINRASGRSRFSGFGAVGVFSCIACGVIVVMANAPPSLLVSCGLFGIAALAACALMLISISPVEARHRLRVARSAFGRALKGRWMSKL